MWQIDMSSLPSRYYDTEGVIMLVNARRIGHNVVTLKQVESGFEVAWNDEIVARDSDYDFAFQKFMEV